MLFVRRLQSLYVKDKCTGAVSDFEMHTPSAGKWKGPLIDWSEFGRTYSVRVSVKHREEELETTWSDFKDDCAMKGWDLERTKAQWDKHKADKNIDREGRGATLKLWLPQRNKRIRDKGKDQVNAFNEGGKRQKTMKQADADSLKDFCHSSTLSFADKFFKEDATDESPLKALKEAAALSATPKKSMLGPDGKPMDLATLAPPQHEKMKDELDKAQAALIASIAKVTAVDDKLDTELDSVAEKSLVCTARLRKICGEMFLANQQEDVDSAVAELKKNCGDDEFLEEFQKVIDAKEHTVN